MGIDGIDKLRETSTVTIDESELKKLRLTNIKLTTLKKEVRHTVAQVVAGDISENQAINKIIDALSTEAKT